MPERAPVLIWAPLGRDGAVVQRILEDAEIRCRVCASLGELEAGLGNAVAAVVAQEGLIGAELAGVLGWVNSQPSWSDFPFVLLSQRGGTTDPRILEILGNVTVLERPVHQTTLVSAVKAARRARLRQFEAGDQLAEQMRIRAALAEETRTLGILNNLGATINAELDLERVVQAVTDAGVALTGAEFGAFFYNVLDDQGESYTLYALSGAPRSKFDSFPMPRNTDVFRPTFLGEGIVRSDDITQDPRYGRNKPHAGMPEGHLPVRSYLAVPVVSRKGEVLGGLFFGHSQPGMFSEAAENIMAGVAGQAATAIDNVRLFDAEQRELEERRRAEAELQRQRDEFLALADNIPTLCWLAQADGSIFWYNHRWYEYTGTTPEEQLGWGWQSVHHPDVLPKVREAWQHSLKTGERFEMVFPLRGADGVFRPFLTRIVPIRDEDGKIVRWCGTNVDITQQQENEAALEARVAARTEELERALERLQAEAVEREKVEEALRQSQKMEAIGQLTGGVAHDFNNLLTVIVSAADALSRRELSEERRKRYIDAIAETADRATKLTSQLLAFARRQPLQEVVFDAAESIQQIVEMLQTVVGSRITLRTDIRVTPALVKTDIAQFETALVNMAVNARDAMDGAGVITLTVAEAHEVPPMRGDPAISGDFVTISVADQGTGLAPHQIDRIFEPFYTTKEVGKGTGLGLSQVYGFAKQAGGGVRVESEPGKGATFTLYLPRTAEQKSVTGAMHGPVEAPGRENGRILVVEDNAKVGEHAAQLLADLGYEAVLVGDAKSALDRLHQAGENFDLVLSDIVMPGLSGLELKTQLAQSHPGLPVILSTGYSDVLVDSGAANLELLRKPYSMKALSSVIRRTLRTKEHSC